MVVAADVYAFALLVAVGPALALARVLWPKRNKPGGQWLVATLVGMAGWSASWGLLVLFDSEAMAWVSLTGVVASVGVTVVGWAMVSLEFTRQSRVPARRTLPLFAVPAVTVVLAATNWYHGLVWGAGTVVVGSVVALDTGPWFAVHSVYAFGLMAASGLLLVRELLTAGGVHRKHVVALVVRHAVRDAPERRSSLFPCPVPVPLFSGHHQEYGGPGRNY